ncbi:MAG: hypothetical protein SCK28_04530 [Bacillota bacterium]|nr:hypothetical protein [Bacillota bacterium]
MRVYKINNQVVTVQKNTFSRPDKLNERTTCSFTIIEPEFEIDVGMEVEVKQDAEIIFAGTVDSVREFGDITKYAAVTCVDFSQLIDKRKVYDTFENELAGDIARAFIVSFFADDGITEGIIQDGPIISKAVFNYDDGNVAMNRLAEITGFSWFIDHDKKLNLFDRATYQAPFGLTDNSNNFQGLQVKKTRGQYRNRQYVRAGQDVTQEIVKEKPTPKPDGVSKTFVVRLPIAQKPRIYIDDIEVDPADIGVNGLDKDRKYYFSFNSNTITQDQSEETLSTEVLEVTYRGLYPLLVVADKSEEIAARKEIEGGSGIYESIIEESNLNTREAAFEFAFGKLEKYGLLPKVITFNTYDHGLKAGQLLPIQNNKYGLDGNYLIEEVTARADGNLTLYNVKALDGAALGGWEQFFKGLLQGNRKLVIRENEVLVLLNTASEQQNWAENTEINIFACPIASENLYPSEDLYPC